MMSFAEATARCWAEVDLTRLVANYKNALKHLSPPARLMAVLKANAYGCGAAGVARRLRREGQREFAVASFEEAAEVSAAVPDAEVLILGLTGPDRLKEAVRRRFMLTVFNDKSADDILEAARGASRQARVQVKVDTGLHRLGFEPERAADAIERLARGGAVVEGVFTHLALRDQPSDRRALDAMYALREETARRGVAVGAWHALDSIGMVRYPHDQMDVVRTGAWLYGVSPRGYDRPDESRLCLTVKARVAQLRKVPAGECLGYDETHPLARDSVIATLSAGYMDGFPRLNSQGSVLVSGCRAPVWGLVCMDQMMVDVTDVPAVREGDAVTLLGGGIGVNEYADLAGLNRNEALARTGRRVPRIYYEDGQVVGIDCDIDR